MKLLVQGAELGLNPDLLIIKPVLVGSRLESWLCEGVEQGNGLI